MPVVPCRLLDTRSGPDSVGPRSEPIGADETYTLRVTGSQGNCELPTTASGVAINVTAANPTDVSWLQLWPADAQQPVSSALNYVAGQAPTPNQIQVKLSPAGDLNIYNRSGSVNVIGDVVGYFTAEGIAELDQRVGALEADSAANQAVCGGLDFVADSAASSYESSDSTRFGGSPAARFTCGLSVPASATITAFSATINDMGPLSSTFCELHRIDARTGDDVVVATTASSAGPGLGVVVVDAELEAGEVVQAGSFLRADCSLNDEVGVIAAVVSFEL